MTGVLHWKWQVFKLRFKNLYNIYVYNINYNYPSKAILQRLPQGFKCDTLHTVHVYPFGV